MKPNNDTQRRFAQAIALAAGCGASPSQILTVALAMLDDPEPAPAVSGAEPTARLDAIFDRLLAKRALLTEIVAKAQAPHRQLAPAPVGPALARMRLDIGDHEVRGRLVFGELVGKKSFFQVVALAIGGVELSASDANLLEQVGVAVQLAAPDIWPLAVVRRVAQGGYRFAARTIAGIASMLNPYMAALPAARAHTMFERIEAAQAEGISLEAWLEHALAAGEKLPGVGRPVLDVDERIPPILSLLRSHGRLDGRNVQTALTLDGEIAARKPGLRINSAGLIAALMRDLGFSCPATGAFVQLYLMPTVLMHAVVDGPAPGEDPTGYHQLPVSAI